MEIEQEDVAIAIANSLNEKTAQIMATEFDKTNLPVQVDKAVRRLFSKYKAYNERLSTTMSPLHPISRIVRDHMQWKALKIAGAFTIMSNRDSITEDDFIQAVNYVETYRDDMSEFENELVKGKHELFAGYMKSIADHGKSQVSLHDLKKLQYITGTGSVPKMKELVELASSYDKDGIYSVEGTNAHYEAIEKTEVTGVSFLMQTDEEGNSLYTKEERQYSCAAGYTYVETDFAGLANSLSTDMAFTPFRLKTPENGATYTDKTLKYYGGTLPEGGVRGMDNIDSGTTWICFDIDKTKLTDEEVHFIISDVNHHIARTSDANNPYKYRVIIQLDAPVKLDKLAWRYFIESISEDLGLPIDKLAQSSIFFGYAGREVLSVTDQYPIEIKQHVTYAIARAAERAPQKELTSKEKSTALSRPMSTFEYAFEAPDGSGSRLLHAAARSAYFKYGASKENAIALVHEISDYWDSPFPPHRLATLVDQIRNF